MSFWYTIKEIILYFKTRDIQGWEDYKASLTPENAYSKLIEYNENDKVKAWLYHGFEHRSRDWMINSFRFSAQAISSSDVLKMARYLNTSEVFQTIAPHEYGSSEMSIILNNLFEKCEPSQRVDLLMTMESRGILQSMIKGGTIYHGSAARFYFMLVVGDLSVEDGKAVLSRSPSFQIAKQSMDFANTTIKEFPDYKDLL